MHVLFSERKYSLWQKQKAQHSFTRGYGITEQNLSERILPLDTVKGAASKQPRKMKNAVLEEYSSEKPVEFTKRYPRNIHYATMLSKDEIKRLLKEIAQTDWLLKVFSGLFCGLRRGEILGLEFGDTDMEERTITISRQLTYEYYFDESGKRQNQKPVEKPPKTENSYKVMRMPPTVLQEIEKRRKRTDRNKKKFGADYHDHDYVCCAENEDAYSLAAFYNALSRACKRAGVPKVSVHDLRHGCASLLLANAVPMKMIQDWLGHSDMGTTVDIKHRHTNKILIVQAA